MGCYCYEIASWFTKRIENAPRILEEWNDPDAGRHNRNAKVHLVKVWCPPIFPVNGIGHEERLRNVLEKVRILKVTNL